MKWECGSLLLNNLLQYSHCQCPPHDFVLLQQYLSAVSYYNQNAQIDVYVLIFKAHWMYSINKPEVLSQQNIFLVPHNRNLNDVSVGVHDNLRSYKFTISLFLLISDAITEPSVLWWQVLMFFQTHVQELTNTLKCSMNVSHIVCIFLYFF